jgi:hypothetical protein
MDGAFCVWHISDTARCYSRPYPSHCAAQADLANADEGANDPYRNLY